MCGCQALPSVPPNPSLWERPRSPARGSHGLCPEAAETAVGPEGKAPPHPGVVGKCGPALTEVQELLDGDGDGEKRE